MLDWLEQCRRVYNYALAERKDWMNSRRCPLNACRIRQDTLSLLTRPIPTTTKELSERVHHCDECGYTEEGKPALSP
jgi:hypothetical protein